MSFYTHNSPPPRVDDLLEDHFSYIAEARSENGKRNTVDSVYTDRFSTTLNSHRPLVAQPKPESEPHRLFAAQNRSSETFVQRLPSEPRRTNNAARSRPSALCRRDSSSSNDTSCGHNEIAVAFPQTFVSPIHTTVSVPRKPRYFGKAPCSDSSGSFKSAGSKSGQTRSSSGSEMTESAPRRSRSSPNTHNSRKPIPGALKRTESARCTYEERPYDRSTMGFSDEPGQVSSANTQRPIEIPGLFTGNGNPHDPDPSGTDDDKRSISADRPASSDSRAKGLVIETSLTPDAEKQTPAPSIPSSSDGGRDPLVPHEPLKIGRLHEIFFIAVVACSHLLTQAGLGQALAPLEAIGETFGVTNLGEMTWFVAGYSLTVGTFILASGRIGDIMGHKKVFVFGYAWLGFWAAICGFAAFTKHQIFFDICRALQGIGPAILMPNGLALFARAYPSGIKKNIVFSIFGAVAPAGFVLGACSGSVFSTYVWWPWSFWTYSIASFCLCILAFLIIPNRVGCAGPNPPSFDRLGALTGVIGLVLINIAWNLAPLNGWSAPQVYCILIMGLIVMAFFCYVESHVKDPLLPIKALDANTGFVLACVGLGWGAFSVWLFYTFRFLTELRHESPLTVTAQFGPAPITGLLAAGLTGFMLTHTPVSFTMLISMVAFCLGCCVGGTATPHQTYWRRTFVSILIMPFGMDMSFPAATVILSNHMPREHQGLAASLVNTVVNYGIATALGIAGTVEAYAVDETGGGDGSGLDGIRSGFYTAMGMSGVAVIVGLVYFARSMRSEGWKVMEH